MENELKIIVAADFSTFDKEVKRAVKTVDGLDESLEETGKDAAKAGKQITDSFKNLPNRVKKLKAETEKLNKSFKENRISVADFTKKSDALEKEMNSLRGTAKKAGVEMEVFGKKSTTGFQKLGTAIKSALGPLLTIFAVIEGSKALAAFEKQIFDIGTLLGDTAETEMPKFQAGLIEIAKNSPTSPEELGSAAYAAVSAGITDTAEALQVVAESAKLGVAGLGSTEAATDLVTSALNSFKAEGLDADDAANVLFETVKNGKTTVEELSASFGSVAPAAAAAGVTFAELQAATAALTTTGLGASEAQTQIRSAITELTKPSKELAALYKEIGVESGIAGIEQEGLVGFLEQLVDSTGDGVEGLRPLIGSVEAFNGILGLTTTVNEQFNNTLSDLTDGVSSLDEAFELQRETVAAQFQELKNGLFALLIQAGSVIIPVLNGVIKTATTLVDGLFTVFGKLADVLTFFTGETVAEGIESTNQALRDQKQIVTDLTDELEKSGEKRKQIEKELTKNLSEEAVNRAKIAADASEGRISLEQALLFEAKQAQKDKTLNLSAEAKARLGVAITETETIREAERILSEEVNKSRRETVRLAIQQISALQAQIQALRGERLASVETRIASLQGRIAESENEAVKSALEGALGVAQDQQKKALSDLDELTQAQTKALLSSAGDFADASQEEINEVLNSISTPEAFEQFQNKLQDARQELLNGTSTTEDYTKVLEEAKDQIDENTTSQDENTTAVGGTTKATEELVDETKELEKDAKDAIKQVNEEFKDYEKTLKEVDKLQESINKKTEEFAESGELGARTAGEDIRTNDLERINELANELVDINREIKQSEDDLKAADTQEKKNKIAEETKELEKQREELKKIVAQTRELVSDEEGTGADIDEIIKEAERVASLSEQEREQELFEAERARLELRQEIFDAQTEEELEALKETADFESQLLIEQRIEKLKTIELEKQQKIALEEDLANKRSSIETEIKNERIQNALEVGAIEQAEAEKLKAILESINIPFGGGGGGVIPQAHEGGVIGGTTGSTTLRRPGAGEVLTMTNPGEFIIPNDLNRLSSRNEALMMNRISPLVSKYNTSNNTKSTNNSINGVTINLNEQPFQSVESFRRVIRKLV